MKHKAFEPFMSSELIKRIDNPIEFDYGGGPSTGKGFEATLLPDLCDAIFLAKKEGRLTPENPYYEAADQAEILMRAFAKVGIVALIDEVTGFAKQVDEYQNLVKFLDVIF